ncbi:hypothetical protein FRC07_009130 [Ceratobasidium sp. 392]|nr:hypothetical protein FRC07_009130 [Ceratobasidium sp. 392]
MKWFRFAAVFSAAVWLSSIATASQESTTEEVEPPVWSTWKDGDKRAWLAANGILSPKVELEEHEQGSDGLNKPLEIYFFEEHETVYSNWSTSQLQMWLARERLEQNGHGEERSAASDREVFTVLAKYFSKGSDATAEYMVWPDGRLRTFLRARGVKEPKKVKRSRSDLIHMVRVRTTQKKLSNEDLVKRLQNVLTSGAEWLEEQLLASLAIFGGTNTVGDIQAGKAMREASRFAMDSSSKQKNIEAEQARLEAKHNELWIKYTKKSEQTRDRIGPEICKIDSGRRSLD